MANGIRTGDPVDSIKDVVRQTPEEGQRTYQLKRCGNNNKDEDYSLKTLNDKNHQASSQKFRPLVLFICIRINLALNNLQRLICHNIQINKPVFLTT